MIYGSGWMRSGTMGNGGGGTDVPAWVFTATNSEADAQKVFNFFKAAGRSDIDSLILAMQEPDMRKLVLDTESTNPNDPELKLWWEQRRGDPYYTMTPDAYAKYVASQQEMSVAQSGAGMSPAARAAQMEAYQKSKAGFRMPLWGWLAIGGGALYFVMRKS